MISLSIIGNIGQDAVVKEVGGKKVIEFSVAHTAKKQDGSQITTWVKCSKWGDTTAVAPYLLKGGKVYVEGIPSSEHWLKDGEAQSSLKLLVNKIELLGGGQKEDAKPTNTNSPVNHEEPEDTSELPF